MFPYFCNETVGASGQRGSGTPEVFLRKQPAKQGPVGQQADVVIAAERDHPLLGPTIDQRKLNLVRDNADALLNDNSQMLRYRNW